MKKLKRNNDEINDQQNRHHNDQNHCNNEGGREHQTYGNRELGIFFSYENFGMQMKKKNRISDCSSMVLLENQ